MGETDYGWDGDSYFDDEMTWEERAGVELDAKGLRLATCSEPGWYINVNGCRGVWVTDLPAP